MNKEEMDKYAYELMIKNNPDEAIKNLLLKDKEIERLNNIINELEKDIKNLYTYGIKNNAEQRDYLLNRLDGLRQVKELKEGK